MPYSNKITYCTMCLDNREEVLWRIGEAQSYVDKIVVVDGGSVDDTMEYLNIFRDTADIPVIVKQIPWKDHWSNQRNNCLKEVDDFSWVLSSDADERFAERTFKCLPMWIELSQEAQRYDLFWVQSISVEVDYKGDEVYHNRDQYWKAQFFFKEPDTHFEGAMHEKLFRTKTEEHKSHLRTRETYDHIKKYGIIWVRGHRNFFVNGGGLNLGERQPLWLPFRALVKEATGIESWHELNRYYIAGNIDQRIKNWFVEYRNHAFDDSYDGSSEVREGYKAYFLFLHPEELTQEMIDTDDIGTRYENEIIKIHGPEKWHNLELIYHE